VLCTVLIVALWPVFAKWPRGRAEARQGGDVKQVERNGIEPPTS
jgi:hypothetical protein